MAGTFTKCENAGGSRLQLEALYNMLSKVSLWLTLRMLHCGDGKVGQWFSVRSPYHHFNDSDADSRMLVQYRRSSVL